MRKSVVSIMNEQFSINEESVRTANANNHGCYQAPQSESVFMNAQNAAGKC